MLSARNFYHYPTQSELGIACYAGGREDVCSAYLDTNPTDTSMLQKVCTYGGKADVCEDLCSSGDTISCLTKESIDGGN